MDLVVEENTHQKIQNKLLDKTLSLKTKFTLLETYFVGTASLPDILSLFPGKVWARLYVEILEQFLKACSIFESFLVRKSFSYFEFKLFRTYSSQDLVNEPGKFQTEILLHSFLITIMLPKAYVSLRSQNLYSVSQIFTTQLRFDTFLRTYAKSDFPEVLQFDSSDYLNNYKHLLQTLEVQLSRSSPRYFALREELINFLKGDLEQKAEKIDILRDESLQPVKSVNSDKRMREYKAFLNECDQLLTRLRSAPPVILPLIKDLQTGTRKAFFELLSGEESGYLTLKGFEQDYKNFIEISEKFMRIIKNDEEFLLLIKHLDYYIDHVLPPHNIPFIDLIKSVIPLIRLCHIILVNAKFQKEGQKDRYKQVFNLTLWRVFRKCLYLEAGILVMDYFIRNFQKLNKALDDSQLDFFITSLFCFLSVMKQKRNQINENRFADLSKKRAMDLLQKFLGVIELKKFAQHNFFVYQDYESRDFMNNIKKSIGKENLKNKGELLQQIPVHIETFSKFTEKIILILTFLKRTLSKIYLNKYDDWGVLHQRLYRLYANLLNLYDINEVRKIHTEHQAKKSPLAFVDEMKYTLIVDCLGLFGVYPQDQAKTLNTYCKQDKLISRDHQPMKLAETLKQFVYNNMFFVDISYYIIFSTLAKLEKSIKQSRAGSFCIQVSQQIEIEQDKGSFDPQNFNLLRWMYQLLHSVTSELSSLLEVCVDLMNVELELSNSIMPFLVHIYLQNCASADVRRIADEINVILEKGKIYHRIKFISCLKTLEQWKKEDRMAQIEYLQKVASEQHIYSTNGKRRIVSSSVTIEFDPKKEKFITNFDLLKSLLNNDQLIKTQYQIGEYKEAMLSIDKILSGRSPEENHDKTYLNYLDMLYRASSKTTEDYKYIGFEEILKALRIKDFDEVLKKEEYHQSVRNIFKATEQAEVLIRDDYTNLSESLFYNDIERECSESVLSFDDDRIFNIYILALLSLASKAVQQFLLSGIKHTALYFEQINLILHNAKLSIIISLYNARNNFQHVYPIFVLVQELIDLEKYFVLLRFSMQVHEKKKSFGTFTISTDQMDITSMKISLDKNHPKFILEQGFNSGNNSGNILIYCFKQIMKRNKNIVKNFKNYFFWLNVTKYVAFLLKKVETLCFDRIYADLNFKAFRLCYNYEELNLAGIYYERLRTMPDKLTKPAKCAFIMAKYLKKTKSKKHAIEMLESIKHKYEGEIFIEINARLKIAKYSHYYYSNDYVIIAFQKILSQYKSIEHEKMHFLYAKTLEKMNPEPDIKIQYEIVQHYLRSCKIGHVYISQSLPRALRIWLLNSKKSAGSQQVPLNTGLSMSYSSNYGQPEKVFEEYVKKINAVVENSLLNIAPYKLVTVVQFLVSRLEIADNESTITMCQALARIAAQFPLQSVWWLLPLKYFHYSKQSENPKSKKSEGAHAIMSSVKKLKFESWQTITEAESFYRSLLDFAINKESNSVPEALLKDLKSNCVIVPCKRFISPKLPGRKEVVGPEFNPFHPRPEYIVKLDSKVTIMQSKERPKKITLVCKAIEKNEVQMKKIPFLLKFEPKGDVRKESRTIEMVHYMNEIMRKSNWTAGRKLKMKTFSIVPLCYKAGLCEWVEDTATIKKIVEDFWKLHNIPHSLDNLKSEDLENQKLRTSAFRDMNKVKPVFQEYFWDNSASSDEWYDLIMNYTKSAAIWSAFGYFIGLGDRHCDNILLHKPSGKLLHIDFDCIFHKGKYLPVPEIVEFRLTKNVEAPLGPFKSYGLFKFYFRLALKALNAHGTDLLEALDSFIFDPLIEKAQFKQSVAMERIRQNITFANYKGLDEAVEVIIEDCKNEKMLKEMFIGWMPHM